MQRQQQFTLNESAALNRFELPPMWRRINSGGIPGEDNDMPILGEVRMFGGAVPALWLPFGSGNVSRTTFAELFGVIGETYGAGDGMTTFGIPGGQRVPIAAGVGGGLSPRAAGDLGGLETVFLTGLQSGLQGSIALTVNDLGHVHGVGSIVDSGHTHDGSSLVANVADGGHAHSGASGNFIVQSAGTEYATAGGDAGVQDGTTAAASTGITVTITGQTGSGQANLAGDTMGNTTGITVQTNDNDAAEAHENMPPFSCFNFAIFANA